MVIVEHDNVMKKSCENYVMYRKFFKMYPTILMDKYKTQKKGAKIEKCCAA